MNKSNLWWALGLAFAVSGCVSTLHDDGKTVLIEHSRGSRDISNAVVQAQQACEKVGKTADYQGMDCPMRCISKFRCVEK